LDWREVEPFKIINAAMDVVRPTAEAKNIRLEAELDILAGTVSGDPERLQQVIWNLLSNAIKFTPEGGRVEIRSRWVDSSVEIVVADTGHGISEDFCLMYSSGSGKPTSRRHARMAVLDLVWRLSGT
jgi:signal transduction histidine kinase